MSDAEARSAPRRPSTARPREDAEVAETMAPPSAAELDSIERSQLEWQRLLGAEVVEDDGLGAVLIHHTDPGPGFNVTARVRWSGDDVAERLAALQDRMRAQDRWPSIIYSEGLSEPIDLGPLLGAGVDGEFLSD